MEEYSNSIPDLPLDILIEVFCRLQVKTLVQLSCVCRFWNDLIRSNRIFIRYHQKQSLNNSTRNSRYVLMYSDWNRNITSTLEAAVQRFINADENCLRKSFFLGSYFFLVGCVNGVFCFYEYWSSDLYLWNPALHQFRMLPRCSYPYRLFNVIAFFSEPTNDDYIVVEIFTNTSKVLIYKLSSNSWKKTNFPYHPSGKYVHMKDMVALVHNGALHWLSSPRYRSDALSLNIYDLVRERFQEILLSDHIPFKPFVATLGLIKGCISVSGRSATDGKDEVWMMKEYVVENSWTKQFEVPSYIIPLIRYLPGTRTSGKFVLTTQENYVVLYDPETEETVLPQNQATLYEKHTEYFFIDNYVESLVSVFPPIKRTASRSSFLRRLFDCLFG